MAPHHPSSDEATDWGGLPTFSNLSHDVDHESAYAEIHSDVTHQEYLTGPFGFMPQIGNAAYHMPTTSSRGHASMIAGAPPDAPVLAWTDSMVITSVTPRIALPGHPISIHFESSIALGRTTPRLYFFVSFDHTSSPGTLTQTDEVNGCWYFMLSTYVPALEHDLVPRAVPLSLIIQAEDGTQLARKMAGEFMFATDAVAALDQAAHGSSSKRKASLDSQFPQASQSKRNKLAYTHDENNYSVSSFSPSLFNSQISRYHNMNGQYYPYQLTSAFNQVYPTPGDSARRLIQPAMYPGGIPMARSVSAYDGNFPATPQYSSPTMAYGRAVSDMGLDTLYTSGRNVSPTETVSSFELRPRQAAKPPKSNDPGTALSAPRPRLVLEEDLRAILDDWTQEESTSGRRLVIFERHQTADALTVSFRASFPEENTSKSICVSCIWWDDKGTAFITSVDTISLIEQLCGYTFSVAIKNRIRRNMEGFKPFTITKERPECEEFFRLIMGFTNPKPRNIEKHIKVFPWKCLTSALNKIVSKYARHVPAPTTTGAKRKQASTRRTTGKANNKSTAAAAPQPLSLGLGSSSRLPTGSGEPPSHDQSSPYLRPAAPIEPTLPPPSKNYPPNLFNYMPPPPSIPQFSIENPLSQGTASDQYTGQDSGSYTNWGFGAHFDTGLAATPTSFQFSQQAINWPELGYVPEPQTPSPWTQSSEFQYLHNQYLNDQAN